MDHETIEACLPPRELWPELVFSLPALQYPHTLNVAAELLDRTVADGSADSPALLFDGRITTYRELQSLVNRVGRALVRLGVQPGDRVAMRIPNRPIFVAAWLAVQKIGAVAVSTMPMLRARELAYIANDSGTTVFICAADLLDELLRAQPAFNHPVTIVTTAAEGGAGAGLASLEALAADQTDALEPHPTASSAVALIAYTSGSTGVPKGAVHTPRDIIVAADTYAAPILQPTPADVFGGHPTIAFTYGLGGLLVFPLRFGASVSLLDRYTPERLLARIADEHITILFCAATTYRLLLQDPAMERAHDLSSLRLCVSAGEPLPATVWEEWHRRTGISILDGIGSTEMFHIFVSSRPDAVRPGSTGLPVPGTRSAS